MTGACGLTTEVEEVVRELMARQLSVSPDAITPSSLLVEDFRADLLSLTQLALALEDEFDIEIADEDWINVATVADVFVYVSSLLERIGAGVDYGGGGS